MKKIIAITFILTVLFMIGASSTVFADQWDYRNNPNNFTLGGIK